MKKETILLLLILILAFFLRVFRVTEMVGFDFDQEYAATFAQTILNVYPIALIGQGLSVQGLFMGPLYFYFLVPFFAITALHPLGGYIGSIVLGLIIVTMYYYVLSPVFGKTTGLIAAFLRAILFYKIQADWVMAPAFSSELAVLITWFCFYKYWHGDLKYLLPLGFVFGIYTSFHPILFPFYLVFLALLLIKRKIPSFKYIIMSVVLFLIPLVPLLLFEYFRNFLEIKLLFSLQSTSSAQVKSLETIQAYASLLFHYPATLIAPAIVGTKQTFVATFFFIIFMIIGVKKIGFWKDRFHLVVFLATIVLSLMYYFFLPIRASDYYFLGSEVIIFIYGVASLSLLIRMKKGFLMIGIVICLITILNLVKLSDLWRNPPPFSLANKEAIIQEIIKRQNGDRIKISYEIDYGQHYGFGYLTRLHNLQENGSDGDPTYVIVLPKSKSQEKIEYAAGDIGLVIRNSK